MILRLALSIALSIALFMTSATTALCSITVDWSASAVTNYSSSDFDVATLTFTGFTADSLDAITGDGFYHNHGSSGYTFGLDVRLDGVWTNIWSLTPPASVSDMSLSTITASSISFASSVAEWVASER